MRTRHPFPDLELGYVASMGDGSSEGQPVEFVPGAPAPALHPDAVERGTAVALGFMPHRAENRKQRLAGVATWQPPKTRTMVVSPETAEAFPVGSTFPVEKYPSRRELWAQRKRQRRGKLDPELRRLQRKAGAK